MNQSDNSNHYSNSVFSRSQRNNHNSRSLMISHAINQTSTSRHEQTPHQIGFNASSQLSSNLSNFIYGTNIITSQAQSTLQDFVMEFQISRDVDGQTISEKIYNTQLNELDIMETSIFTVLGRHLKQFDTDLYYQFVYFPAQMLWLFEETVRNLYQRLFIDRQEDVDVVQRKNFKKMGLMVSIKSMIDSVSLRDLNQSHINKMISIKGIVIRCSEIYPEMIQAYFKCVNCNDTQKIQLENAKINEPKICEKCRLKDTLEIQHNLCKFNDKQFIKFQQLPEFVTEGQTPSSITMISYDHNVDGLRPGDRVQIVGIYRVGPSKIQKNLKIVRSVYNTYLDVISYNRIQEKTLKILDQNIVEIAYTDDDKSKFAQMADSTTILDDLAQAFAPSIFGHQQVKKGLLAQLFGGTKKDFSKLGRGRWRSDINICLVGDPSTAKSQLLQQVHKISPRGIYTSGRGSSAVGLTANVRKDPQTKQFVLQSGALVLSDLGICCIDQFDKMDPQSRLILLQAMQQQTISIAKAGIVCQLNSRTAILCAANPVNSRYNSKKSVVQNINLQPALLTRFDLIYILLDQPNQQFDTMLATHILNLYSEFEQKLTLNQKQPTYSKQILTKYITYAKQYVHPVLDQAASDKLVDAYSEMRKIGNSKKVITATTRQLESLIRIAQAFAKMRLSSLVQEKDVDEAIALVKFATQQAATDPTTGLIDMDVLVTGKTASTRRKINRIKDIIWELIKGNVAKYKKSASIDMIKLDIDKKLDIGERATDEQIIQALKMHQTEGNIVLFGSSKNRPNFRLARDLHTM